MVPRQSPYPQGASALVREKAAMMSVRYNYNTCPKKDSEVSGVGWGCLIIQGIRTGSPVQAAFRQLDERCEDGRGVFLGKRHMGRRHSRCKGPEVGACLVGGHVSQGSWTILDAPNRSPRSTLGSGAPYTSPGLQFSRESHLSGFESKPEPQKC